MNISEELQRIESGDLSVSQKFVQRLKGSLNAIRDPELLGDIIDYQLQRGSTTAVKVLASLKDIHSQDFFAKLHDCLLKVQTRLPALRLLAHMLNSQASWLYKIVDSPVFLALLQFLRSSCDLILLSATLYVLCAVMPLAPYHVSKHLPDLFEGFTRSAMLKSTLTKLPAELFLGLDVAVFYLFLQLYALYPCKFLQYLKARFGPTGEVKAYNEHIAPLFHHVQLHPNLVTDLPVHETQRTRWSSHDPHDIATLALSLCTDPSIVQADTHLPQNRSRQRADTAPASSSIRLINQVPCDPKLCGPLDEADMVDVWSPLATLGDITPNSSNTHSRLSNINTTPSSPSSDQCLSGSSSMQTTPLPASNGEKKFSYSPTASVEGEASVNESSHKPAGSPASSSRNTSGCSSPVKILANTPRSFRQIVSGMFRRGNAPEIREDFSNISVSELDAVIGTSRDNLFTQSETTHGSSRGCGISSAEGLAISLKVPETLSPPLSGITITRKQDTPSSMPASQGVIPAVLNKHSANSCPNEEVLIKARERLNTWKQLEERKTGAEEGFVRLHRPSLVTSYESIATLTPLDEDSVCSLLLHQTIESPDKRDSHGNGVVGVVLSSLSPSAALDQYIRNGNVLHVGRLRDVPMAELEGVDWDYYGGCPHSEELKIKTALAAMLHSQVLFERHQCQQHARRNRRLMSKARTSAKLENEVLALRCRLHQQDELIVNLQSDGLSQSLPGTTIASGMVLSQNRALHDTNRELQDEVKRLREEVEKVRRKNKQLTERLCVVESLEKENDLMKNKLKEVSQVQTQMESMLKEQLVIEELYHQQKTAVAVLRREKSDLQQLRLFNKSLASERDGFARNVKSLRQEVVTLKGLLKERQQTLNDRDNEITELKSALQTVQDQFHEKKENIEKKYQAVKNANLQLEEQIFELKARTQRAPPINRHQFVTGNK